MAATKRPIELAIERAGGVRPLCRILDWNPGSLMRVVGGEKISPFRAGQVADYLELAPAERDAAIRDALRAMSKSESESDYWASLQKEAALLVRAKTLALAAWFEFGDRDPKLYEELERETLEGLKAEAESKGTARRRTA